MAVKFNRRKTQNDLYKITFEAFVYFPAGEYLDIFFRSKERIGQRVKLGLSGTWITILCGVFHVADQLVGRRNFKQILKYIFLSLL